MSRRRLRITVAWGVPGMSDDVEEYELPAGWDEMSEERRDMEIADYVMGIVLNRISGYGEVIDTGEGA